MFLCSFCDLQKIKSMIFEFLILKKLKSCFLSFFSLQEIKLMVLLRIFS
eukprot:UN06458